MTTKNKRQIHVHVDADAFFASVEQVLHHELAGKPIVVGQNGGIVSALSYPAKALGIPRVAPIMSVRKKYPQVQIVASDTHSYHLFSQRMENIIRVHFPNLVKNSIDEGSIDAIKYFDTIDQTKKSIKKLQQELYEKLGCTFSFGIASTPLLAKLASGLNKPHGITTITDKNIQEIVYPLPVNYLSGIGRQSHAKLKKYQIKTIGDFARCDAQWLDFTFSKVMPALQQQVLGNAISIPKQKDNIKSMSRDRTFPKTTDYHYLHSQLSMNIEHLAKRMRSEQCFTQRIGVKLRDEHLSYSPEVFVTLNNPTRDAQYLLSEATKILESIYQEHIFYRQVSVTCTSLTNNLAQQDLFGAQETSQQQDHIFSLLDSLEQKLGTNTIQFASSMQARQNHKSITNHREPNDIYPHPLLPGEESEKRLMYPFLGQVT